MTASRIEWTGHSWNPVAGCSLASPGCTHCYAMSMARRLNAMGSLPHYAGLTRVVNGHAVWTGKISVAPDSIVLQPLQRKTPTTYFVNSMSDLFHEDVPDAWIDRIFAVIALSPQHTFQVLTKRASRMREYMTPARAHRVGMVALDLVFSDHARNEKSTLGDGIILEGDIPHLQKWPLPNVWLGVSCEDQRRADERIPHLLETPAAIRFISAEPLLGPIDLENLDYYPFLESLRPDLRRAENEPVLVYDCLRGHMKGPDDIGLPKLDWVIVGGESGPGARPMHPDWARSLRDQCAAAGVPYFMKQWGEYLPVGQTLRGRGKVHGATAVKPGRMKLHVGGTRREAPTHVFAGHGVAFTAMPDGRLTFRVGKKAAGRLLDGVEHNGMPEVHA